MPLIWLRVSFEAVIPLHTSLSFSQVKHAPAAAKALRNVGKWFLGWAEGFWGGSHGVSYTKTVPLQPSPSVGSSMVSTQPTQMQSIFLSLSLWLGFQLLSKRRLLHEHPASVSEASLQKRLCCFFRLPARPNERQSVAETRTKGFLGQVAFLLKGALLAEEGAPLRVPLLHRTLD